MEKMTDHLIQLCETSQTLLAREVNIQLKMLCGLALTMEAMSFHNECFYILEGRKYDTPAIVTYKFSNEGELVKIYFHLPEHDIDLQIPVNSAIRDAYRELHTSLTLMEKLDQIKNSTDADIRYNNRLSDGFSSRS